MLVGTLGTYLPQRIDVSAAVGESDDEHGMVGSQQYEV